MSLNALDYIPANLHAAILNRTSSVDVSSYLQTWLDEAAATRQKAYLPAGKYTCGGALYVTRENASFETNHMEGDGGGYTDFLSQSTLVFTRLDQPGLIVDKGRGVRIAHIQLTGGNTATPFPPSDDPADYESPGVRTNQTSPHCGIAIDGTLGPTPGDGGYPDLTYGSDVNVGSKNIRIEDVSIRSFLVGVMVSPNNTKQAEQVVMTNSAIGNCEFAHSTGQAQARAGVVSNCDIENCRIAFAGARHGQALQGIAPIIENCQFVLVHRGIEFNDQFGGCFIKGCYFEQCNLIGTYGFGFSSTKFQLHISDCSFHFRSNNGRLPPIILDSLAPVVITSTQFRSNDISAPFMNFVGTGRILFDGCVFYGAWRDNSNEFASIAQRFSTGGPQETHEFRNCLIVSPNDFDPLVVENVQTVTNRIIAGCSNINVQADTITYTLNDPGDSSLFAVNQLIMLQILPQGKSLNSYQVATAQIASIDDIGGVIVCNKLIPDDDYDPALFDLTIRGLISDQFPPPS